LRYVTSRLLSRHWS